MSTPRRRRASTVSIMVVALFATSFAASANSSVSNGTGGPLQKPERIVELERVPFIAAPVGSGSALADQMQVDASMLTEVAAPQVDDPISEAELQDLETVASQSGMSLEAAIDRYAWNDNFALVVRTIREASPEAFTGAEIIDSDSAWVGFSDRSPDSAWEAIRAFGENTGVSIDIRNDMGFTEQELTAAIETVHFAILERLKVRDAFTSFEFATDQITIAVVLDRTAPDSSLRDLQAAAMERLGAQAATSGILDHVTLSVVDAIGDVIGGDESNTEHLGGESLSSCTSGFGTITSSGTRGIATAGHCSDSQTDDGVSLTTFGQYVGNYGDFQWMAGSQQERDDFYSGTSTTTEANRRDVSSVGPAPLVGQTLCRNGKYSHKDCQEVRKINVCSGSICYLTELEAHLSTDGDSGAPVFYSNAAKGIHRGYVYDPWPFDREVSSRADLIDNAMSGVFIATS